MNKTEYQLRRIFKIVSSVVFFTIVAPMMVLRFFDINPRNLFNKEEPINTQVYDALAVGQYPVFDCESGTEIAKLTIREIKSDAIMIDFSGNDFSGLNRFGKEYNFTELSLSNITLYPNVVGTDVLWGTSDDKTNLLITYIQKEQYSNPIPDSIWDEDNQYFFMGVFSDFDFTWYYGGDTPIPPRKAMRNDFYNSMYSGIFYALKK